MRMKTIFALIVVAAVAGIGGWYTAKHSGKSANAPTSNGGRKILYYQSPMHPWITSDKPGRCTICGMALEPIYEGQRAFAANEGVIMLGSNTVQAIHVQTEIVTNRPLVRTLRVAGIIEDDDTKHRRLSTYAEGRIEKLFVNFVGAEVTAGQPLAVFYSPALLTVESEYLTLLQQKLSTDASDTLREERARLIEAAGQRLKRLGYSGAQLDALARKKSADARTEILAPMTGTVVSRNVYEGQYVKEGDVLFEIGDFSTMWFQFDGYERDLSWLRVGQPVEITTPALPGKTLTAPITFIDPNLNPMTRSAKVRVEVPNPFVGEEGRRQRLLYHKMYADGAVKVTAPEVLAVPRSAVLSAGEPLAYVEVGEGAYESRKVKLGRRGDDWVEVLDGVKAGERVVTAGNLLIDAQAQLNATTRVMGEQAPRGPAQTAVATNRQGIAEPVTPALNEAQQTTVREFLKLTSDLGATLASDDVKTFNDVAPRVHVIIPKLLDSVGGMKTMRPALQKLEASGHLEKAENLAAARKQFLPFSMAAAELAQQLRTMEAFKETKIFNCPMVNRAIPGAAKNGQWLQLAGPLKNPFFGSQMLDCGNEVK